jgi:ABC-type multidrug transport system fused ATPase/permease subunit
MILTNFSKVFKLISWKYKKNFFIIVFYSILISIFEFISIGTVPILLASLFNLKDNNTFEYIELIKSNLYIFELFNLKIILVVVAIVFFLKFILAIIFFYKETFFRKQITDFFRIILFKNFLELNYLDQINFKKGDLLKRILSDPSTLASLLTNYIFIIRDFLTIFIIVFFMLIFNFKITLLSIVLISLLSIFFIFFYKKKLKIFGEQDQKLRSELNITTDNTFTSSKEIKVMGFEKKFVELFSILTQKQSMFDFKSRFIISLPKIIFEILIVLFILFILFFSKDLETESSILLIQASVYIYAFSRLLPSANSIVSNLSTNYYFFPSINFIEEGLKLNSNNKIFFGIKSKTVNNIKNFNFIIFKNISVYYKEKFLIKNLNFSIQRNKINLIKGPSGAGKSTCLNVLSGLIKPSGGEILFDDISVSLFANSLWKSQLGYLTQSNYLFNSSIMENITFKDNFNEIDKDKFHFSLQLSKLNKVFNIDKIKNFVVGINGNKVSGGQAQKILFARAIYFGQNILILDEPTTALDDASKEDMLLSLNILSQKYKYTIIISTHENFKNLDCNLIELNHNIN